MENDVTETLHWFSRFQPCGNLLKALIVLFLIEKFFQHTITNIQISGSSYQAALIHCALTRLLKI